MRFYISILIILSSHGAASAPVVLADYGGRLTNIPDLRSVDRVSVSLTMPDPNNYRYPISSEMKPGHVETKSHPTTINLTTPFFIVGADDLSLEWLVVNAEYLGSIGAQGLATNLRSVDDFDRLQSAAPTLHLQPAHTAEIETMFGISSYPILVTKDEVSQ